MREWKGLIVSFVAVFVIAGLGGVATAKSVSGWYATLAKPSWTPPGWVFGPAWTVLYALMAASAWMVWRERLATTVTLPLALFGAQLLLNGLWSPLFFGLRQPGWALIDVGILWAAIGLTLAAFWPVNHSAALLLVPYWLWVSYATALNYAIWLMNR